MTPTTVEYIQRIARELAEMAERERLPPLSYLFRMAELEADILLHPIAGEAPQINLSPALKE